MRTTTRIALLVSLFALAGFFVGPDLQAQETVATFEVQPSGDYLSQIQQTPAQFGWEEFLSTTTLRVEQGTVQPQGHDATVELVAVVIRDGQVVDRTSGELGRSTGGQAPFTGTAGKSLSEFGASQQIAATLGELFPGSEWVPSNHWVPTNNWRPTVGWEDQQLAPRVSQAMAAQPEPIRTEDPAPSEAAIVVLYATYAGEQLRDRILTQPMGIALQRR